MEVSSRPRARHKIQRIYQFLVSDFIILNSPLLDRLARLLPPEGFLYVRQTLSHEKASTSLSAVTKRFDPTVSK